MQNLKKWKNQTSEISIATFNVLADSLCESGGFSSDPKVLTWDYRKKLYSNIFGTEFNIICLQEVDHFEFFEEILKPLNYKGIWYKKNSDNKDGLAMFYRTDLFDLKDKECKNYYSVKDGKILKGSHIYLRATFKIKSSNKEFTVITTHLKAKPENYIIRGQQTAQLTLEASRFSNVIICGDFNDTPESECINLMKNYYLSAYELNNNSNELWTTCKKRQTLVKRNIDYIFSKMNPTKILELPNAVILPNEDHPSDHILIAATYNI